MTGWRRYIARFAAVLALAGGLSSCAGGRADIQLVEIPEREPAYLSFFSVETEFGTDISKFWAEEFNKQSKRQVYIQFDSANYYAAEGLAYRELLEKRLQSAAPDDLYIINAEDVLKFGKKGYWMDLSGMKCLENLSGAALYQSSYDGKVFSIPLTFDGFGLYWNVDLLKKFGLSIPSNREEFLAACEVLKEGGVLPYGANKGYSLTVPVLCANLAELYASPDREELLSQLNDGTVPFSDYLRKGFAFLQLLIDRGYLDPEQAMSHATKEEFDGFQAGEYAFVCGLLGDSPADAKTMPFEVKMTGFPLLEDGCVAVNGASSRLCVNPRSKNLELTLQFLEMVGTTEALRMSGRLSGTMSVTKDGGDPGPALQQEFRELLRRPDQIPVQDFSLHFNTWESVRDICREICQGLGVEEACEALDALQRRDLESYGA